MNTAREKLLSVVEILQCPSKSLKELALLSKRDPFSFYQGADLRNLDLEGQDLQGLNFKNADIRFSKLSSCIIDPGAFNESVLDDTQALLADQFIFDIDDLVELNPNDILLFARHREHIVDEVAKALGTTFRDLSANAGISEAALRKLRAGKVVSLQTARSFYIFVKQTDPLFALSPLKAVHSKLRQPNVQLLIGGNNSPFKPIDRFILNRLFDVRRARDYSRGNISNILSNAPRDTAEYLAMFEDLLEDGRTDLKDGFGYLWFMRGNGQDPKVSK